MSALKQRCEELAAALRRIDDALAKIAPGDPAWSGRLQPIVHNEVARLEEALARLPSDPVQQWTALARLEARVARLSGETLAFVGGVGARTAHLDEGSCGLADRLLTEVARPLLQHYKPVTVPAATEYIDVLSEVIRVRYPGAGVWDLPVTLHELGHYLVPRLGAQQGTPIRAIVEEQRAERAYLGAFAEELWADTFAVYVGGPAYACNCVARFAPTGAHDDARPSHPASSKRVSAMLRTMALLVAAWERSGKASGSLEPMVALARDAWRERLVAAGQPLDPPADALAYAESLAQRYVDVLDDIAVVARFDDARRAAAVRKALEAGDDVSPAGCSMVDVLNGAWWARAATEAAGRADRVPALTAAATAMCATIA